MSRLGKPTKYVLQMWAGPVWMGMWTLKKYEVHTFSICTSQYTIWQEICSHYLYDLLYSNKWLKNIHFTVSRLVIFSFNWQKALLQPAPDWSRINRSLSQPLKKSCYQLYFITLLMVNTERRIFHPQPLLYKYQYYIKDDQK